MFFGRFVVQLNIALGNQPVEHGESHIRIDGAGPESDQQRHMHHFARLGGFDDQRDLSPLAPVVQVVVHGRQSQQRRDRSMFDVDAPIAQNHIIVTVVDRFFRHSAKSVNRVRKPLSAVCRAEQHRQGQRPKSFVTQIIQNIQFGIGQDRTRQFDHFAVFGRRVQDISADRADVTGDRHDQFFADRIDRRIGHLRELLPEIVEQPLRFGRQNGQRRVVAHRTERFETVFAHRLDKLLDVLPVVPEHAQHPVVLFDRMFHLPARSNLVQHDPVPSEPLFVRMFGGELFLDFRIVTDFALLGVDHQDFTGTQTTLFADLRSFDGKRPGLRSDHHHVVLGNKVTGRAQAVTVEHTAGITAVRKKQRRRAVPRLHENAVVFVKSLQFGGYRIFIVIAFRNQHRQRMG